MGQAVKHVIYKNGSWVVQVNGHGKSAVSFPTKLAAIKAAVSRTDAPVLIHNKRGQILSWPVDGNVKRNLEILDVVHAIGRREPSGRRSLDKLAA